MPEEGIDLRAYWYIFLRWWWVFVLAVVGAIVVAYFFSRGEIPIYQATTKVFVQDSPTTGVPTAGEITASYQLAAHYSVLIKTRPILEQVVEQASLPYGYSTLAGKIDITSAGSFIEISAKDPDPGVAANLANTVANVFIEDLRVRQLTQIAQFQASLDQYGITQDPGVIVAAQVASLSNLSVLEEATPPGSPISTHLRRNLVLAAVVGLLVAGLVVFILEYLDDSIKSPEELKSLTDLVALGTVPLYKGRDGISPIELGDGHQRNPMTEPYNFLRTNLEFATLGNQSLKTVLVTSSNPSEGKTTTTVNLAASIAREGKSVILVDSDLRRPSIHRIFDLRGHTGLTQVIMGTATLDEALAPTPIPGLKVLVSGPLPPDPTAIIRSPRMKEVLTQLQSRADLVFLDSPPIMAVSDPIVLAGMADCVLLVVAVRSARRQLVKRAADSIRQANPAVVGAVLNKVGEKGGGYYYYYYRYYQYGEDGFTRRNALLPRHVRGFRQVSKVFNRALRGGRRPRHADAERTSESSARLRGS